MATSLHWRYRVGNQRDWVWRGWQTRYTYLRAATGESSTPLILLHGFGASIGHWRQNLAALSQHHTVYALDLLGFGASEKTSAPYSAVFWAEQVYDFWKTFVGQPVVLVGHSVGSMVCLAVAAKYPEMVKGLIMINLPDSSVLEAPEWLQKSITRPFRWSLAALGVVTQPLLGIAKGVLTSPLVFYPLFRLIRSASVIKLWAKQAYATPTAITDEVLEIFSSPAYDRGAVRALRAMIHPRTKAEMDYTARNVLPKLDIPILLLWGEKDRMVPPKLGPLFIKYNPRLTLVAIENAGHCPHDECPEKVNRIILDWLATWQLSDTASFAGLFVGNTDVTKSGADHLLF